MYSEEVVSLAGFHSQYHINDVKSVTVRRWMVVQKLFYVNIIVKIYVNYIYYMTGCIQPREYKLRSYLIEK
jgi:hypothetical protein